MKVSGAGAIQPDEHAGMSQALVGYSDPDQMIQKAFEAMSRLDKAAFCSDLAQKVKMHGYVYVAWNSLFPTLVKIGATSRQNPFLRLKELSTAGVPGRFELVCCMATMNPFQLEKQIHAFFKGKRSFGYRKEFFEVSVDEVVGYFDQLAGNGVTEAILNDNAREQHSAKPSNKTAQILMPVTSTDYPALAVWQIASKEIFVSANSFIRVCIDQDGDAARSRLSALLKRNPGLKPASNIATATSNDEWTFSFTISRGQDVILLSLDAMDHVLQKLAGRVKNNKALLQAYIERCRSSFPFQKRGPVLCVSTSLEVERELKRSKTDAFSKQGEELERVKKENSELIEQIDELRRENKQFQREKTGLQFQQHPADS